MTVVDQIESGNESGDVQIGPSAYLGIGAADGNGGVAVEQVEAGTGAADAGLALGDTITAVDGTKVATADALVAQLVRPRARRQREDHLDQPGRLLAQRDHHAGREPGELVPR